MAHISYKTPALVLASLPRGEANKTCILLTPDQGLLYAHTQGVRFEKSKLRFSLGDYCYSEVMLVHGKSGWRLTNASLNKDLYREVEKENFMVIARVFSLIRKLVTGEEGNQVLFAHTIDAIEALSKTNMTSEEISRVEIAWVLKILFTLGYINPGKLKEHIDAPFETVSLSSEFDLLKEDALVHINKAIHSSQLYF